MIKLRRKINIKTNKLNFKIIIKIKNNFKNKKTFKKIQKNILFKFENLIQFFHIYKNKNLMNFNLKKYIIFDCIFFNFL